jgi:hypothetical protein
MTQFCSADVSNQLGISELEQYNIIRMLSKCFWVARSLQAGGEVYGIQIHWLLIIFLLVQLQIPQLAGELLRTSSVKGHVMQCSCPSKGLGFTCLKIFVLWVAEALSRYSYKVGGCKE